MRVLIINKQSIIQVSLRLIIEKKFKNPVIDWTSCQVEAKSAVKSLVYDVVFITVEEIGKSAFDLVKQIKDANPLTKIIVYLARPTYSLIVTYFRLGARGLISHDTDFEEFSEMFDSVFSSRTYLGRDLRDLVIENSFPDKQPRAGRKKDREKEFSEREKQIVAFLIEGRSTSSIAELLDIAKTTVSTHKSHIYSKTGAKNIIDLREKVMSHYSESMIAYKG